MQAFFYTCGIVPCMNMFNPLSPKSGQYQISPCNVNAL